MELAIDFALDAIISMVMSNGNYNLSGKVIDHCPEHGMMNNHGEKSFAIVGGVGNGLALALMLSLGSILVMEHYHCSTVSCDGAASSKGVD